MTATEAPSDPSALVSYAKEAFGRVVWSHKTHEKARELATRQATRIKKANVALTAATSGTLLANVVTTKGLLLIVSAVFSTAALALTLLQLHFQPEQEANRHRLTALKLWSVRERYASLLALLIHEKIDLEHARREVDRLNDMLEFVYAMAPPTSSKAYKLAEKALRVDGEMSFDDGSIDRFLPPDLRGADEGH